jgi:hypothetical protein
MQHMPTNFFVCDRSAHGFLPTSFNVQERWWRSAWVENTWLRRDLAFRIIVPVQSFDQQQILRVPGDSHHSAGSAVRLEGCNNTESIA